MGRGGGVFLPPHPGRSGDRASRMPSRVTKNMTKTHDRWREAGEFLEPRGSGQFPGWSGNISLHVWQCGGAVATLEMLECQVGWGDKSQTHPWVPGPMPHWPSGHRAGCPPSPCPTWDRKAHGHRPRDKVGPVHFLWTWTLAYSEWDGSGLGAGCFGVRLRWTMSRSA